ncbi:hypothetical protein [Streptomyces sp. NPDC087270]|uniref:hypothetical protein n=1 Tax=Streptomyces sp. NPDC087270 TaxID=3365774 RepID=UPI00381797D7
MLSIDICRRILQRPLAGYADIVEHTAAFATNTGISKPMQRKLHEMLRIALAVGDADGDDLVDELVLDDIPNYGQSVREILLRVGMLKPLPPLRELERPQRTRSPRATRRVWTPRALTPRSCQQCGSWFAAKTRVTCEPCASFATRKRGNSTASAVACDRCRRTGLPLADGRCRGCRWHVAHHGQERTSAGSERSCGSVHRSRHPPASAPTPPRLLLAVLSQNT